MIYKRAFKTSKIIILEENTYIDKNSLKHLKIVSKSFFHSYLVV